MGFVVGIWFLNDSSAEGPLSPIVKFTIEDVGRSSCRGN